MALLYQIRVILYRDAHVDASGPTPVDYIR